MPIIPKANKLDKCFLFPARQPSQYPPTRPYISIHARGALSPQYSFCIARLPAHGGQQGIRRRHTRQILPITMEQHSRQSRRQHVRHRHLPCFWPCSLGRGIRCLHTKAANNITRAVRRAFQCPITEWVSEADDLRPPRHGPSYRTSDPVIPIVDSSPCCTELLYIYIACIGDGGHPLVLSLMILIPHPQGSSRFLTAYNRTNDTLQ